MELFDIKSLVLIKYEPGEILFINRNTRQTYRYLDSSFLQEKSFDLNHQNLLTGLPFKQGVLYSKEQSTLMTEIFQRARSHIKQQFSEQEIVNTFQPLFDCLSYLHQNGVIHGSIHPENIVIIDEEIKLRDGRAPTTLTSQYYKETLEREDDIHALGVCLLNCVFLTTENPDFSQAETLLMRLFDRFSRSFVIALIIIIRKEKKYYSSLAKYLEGSAVADEYLKQSFDKLQQQHERKNKPANDLDVSYVHVGAIKKFAIGNPKKVNYHENIQNKLQNEGKKSGQKSGRISEKGATAHELMSKRMNEEERRIKEESLRGAINKTAILNLSNFGLENNSRKLQKERMSPAIKTRNYSKKK